MTDIREILNALDEEDKRLWLHHRTEMRRSYLTAHNSVLGIHTWSNADDMFMDYIDIKLALLFDQSGRTKNTKTIVSVADAEKVEATLAQAQADRLDRLNGNGKQQIQPSPATQMMQSKDNVGWTSQIPSVRNAN